MSANSNKRDLISKILVLLLCVDLFGGRWITYIGVPGTLIFFLDSIFILTCFFIVLTTQKSKDKVPLNLKKYEISIITILLIFIIFQFFRNQETQIVFRIRDLLPFVYLLFIPVLRLRLVTVKLVSLADKLVWTTIAHSLWAIPSARGMFEPIELGGFFQEPLFGVRTDQSGFVLAIGILACFYRISLSYRTTASSFLILYFVSCAIFLNGRAALLAVLSSLFIGYLMSRKEKAREKGTFKINPLVIILFCFSLLALSMYALNINLPEDSNLKRIGIVGSETGEGKSSGESTRRGREKAQRMLLDWTVENKNVFLGAGPGSEMLFESGAVRFLSGDLSVRSPHSWPLGLFSRFGIIGFALWFLSLIFFLPTRAGIKSKILLTRFPESLIIPILITSLFGVIIESPFGMLPLVIFIACAKK